MEQNVYCEELQIDSIVYDDEKMQVLLKEINKRLKEARIKRNISRARLAELSNLTTNYIFKMENNQCEVGLKSLLKISMALGITPEEFLPVENPERVITNGDRFEQIVADADVRTINYLLKQAEQMVEFQKKQKGKTKQK